MVRNLRQWVVRRKRPAKLRRPPLTENLILRWADDHFRHYGQWPTAQSGRVRAALDETWLAIKGALWAGVRGLPGVSSLARLLAKRRNVRNKNGLPPLTIPKILKWADTYHRRTGRWPTASSGSIPDAIPGETWQRVQGAIAIGCRGLAPGSSLAWILAEHRGAGRYYTTPPLTETEILRWADNYFRRCGKWPIVNNELIPESTGDSWQRIDAALRRGDRELKGHSSLCELLGKHRKVRYVHRLPSLTAKQILKWADAHFQRTGRWPTIKAGPIELAPNETWTMVDNALRAGSRGLPGGSSLLRVLMRHRGIEDPQNPAPLSMKQILKWAREHRRRTGRWPQANSGLITGGPGIIWSAVNDALRSGRRGFPGGSSLSIELQRIRAESEFPTTKRR